MAILEKASEFILQTVSKNAGAGDASAVWVEKWFLKGDENLVSKLADPARSDDRKRGLIEGKLEDLLEDSAFASALEAHFQLLESQKPARKNVIDDSQIEVGGNFEMGDKGAASAASGHFSEKNAIKGSTIKAGGDFRLGDDITGNQNVQIVHNYYGWAAPQHEPNAPRPQPSKMKTADPLTEEQKKKIRDLIGAGNVKKAIERGLELTETDGWSNPNEFRALQQRLSALQNREMMGILSFSEANQERNSITYSLIQLLDLVTVESVVTIPPAPENVGFDPNQFLKSLLESGKNDEAKAFLNTLGIDPKKAFGETEKPSVAAPSEADLERVLGAKDYLVKIGWLSKGLRAARSVCRVVLPDGKNGTGFVLEGGFLLTNFHVLPTRDHVARAKIEFNFEENEAGQPQNVDTYFLSADDAVRSNILEFDYCCAKILDPNGTLGQWGFLETEDFFEAAPGDPVNIIQHPESEVKQIALTYNYVLGTWEHRLFYQTDTKKGSSGSPVFNKDWKVIALHHAGRGAEDGGLQINEKGDRMAANEGILIRFILEDLKKKHGG